MSSHASRFSFFLMPSALRVVANVLFMVPFTTYYLGPEDFGIFATIALYAAPIIPLSGAGSAWVLGANFFKIERQDHGSLIFSLLAADFLLRTLWVVVFGLVALPILPMLITEFEPHYYTFYYLMLGSLWLSAIWPTVSQVLILQESAKRHALLEVLQWLGQIITLVVCLWLLDLHLLSLFIAPLVAAFVSVIGEIAVVRAHLEWRFSRRWMREILHIGLPAIPTNCVELVGNLCDRFFIQQWMTATMLGLYAHAQSYMMAPRMLIKSFSKTLAPSVLKSVAGTDSIEFVARLLRSFYLLLALAGIGVAFFSLEVINLLTHGKFNAAAPLMPVMYVQAVALTYGSTFTQILISHRRSKVLMWTQVGGNVLTVLVMAVAVRYGGMIAAAAAGAAALLLQQIAKGIVCRRMKAPAFGENFFWVIPIATLSAAVLVEQVHPPMVVSSAAYLLVVVLFGAAWLVGGQMGFFLPLSRVPFIKRFFGHGKPS